MKDREKDLIDLTVTIVMVSLCAFGFILVALAIWSPQEEGEKMVWTAVFFMSTAATLSLCNKMRKLQ